ncbi:acyltransferase family protein [Aureicoccus marinus]|jgi:peptidoglycan/LPS O-acetylase OafA/YrhL|uniref:Acyltransferase 3 domain-containing protein n=1 Tax=Aureicoccus marinus TaxID=754435 RepID=A0A2S7T6E4_9FLAO|nr:acyltransferase [Aureicoccus marinus]PQJ15244.1 hypothetical protein BST99_05420 [Aureicoccus marinus]
MRLHKLDGLRGLFSLMVVFFHFDPYAVPSYLYPNFIIRESWTFVDFFFVLSGFVISLNYHHLSSKEALWLYMKKRFIRLYPLLFYTVMLFFIVDVSINYLMPKMVENVDSIGVLITRLFDSLLFMNSTPVLGNSGGINGPSWSISAEMIAYMYFGLLLVFTPKKLKNVLFVIGILLGYAILILAKVQDWALDLRFIRGIISFSIGYFTWFFYNKKPSKSPNVIEYLLLIVLGLLLFQLHSMVFVPKMIFFTFIFPLFFGVFIYLLTGSNGLLSKLMDSKLFRYLGKLSYSIYLNHFLLVLVVPAFFFKYLKITNTDTNTLLSTLLVIILTIGYSHLTNLFIEQKCGKELKKWIFGA